MKAVLQCSGGKDSLACLHFMKAYWPDLTVMWVNTGAAFPETIQQMRLIEAMVPNFLEVKSQQSIETAGYPADAVPVSATVVGQLIEGRRTFTYQSRYDCCNSAIWQPMNAAVRELGATLVIRGQKRSDAKKSPIESGQTYDGITYEFPLQEWTDQDVADYLDDLGVVLPANYRTMNTGLDCWNCTAYLDENGGKLEYMARHHPDKHATVRAVIENLHDTLDEQMAPLRNLRVSTP